MMTSGMHRRPFEGRHLVFSASLLTHSRNAHKTFILMITSEIEFEIFAAGTLGRKGLMEVICGYFVGGGGMGGGQFGHRYAPVTVWGMGEEGV